LRIHCSTRTFFVVPDFCSVFICRKGVRTLGRPVCRPGCVTLVLDTPPQHPCGSISFAALGTTNNPNPSGHVSSWDAWFLFFPPLRPLFLSILYCRGAPRFWTPTRVLFPPLVLEVLPGHIVLPLWNVDPPPSSFCSFGRPEARENSSLVFFLPFLAERVQFLIANKQTLPLVSCFLRSWFSNTRSSILVPVTESSGGR